MHNTSLASVPTPVSWFGAGRQRPPCGTSLAELMLLRLGAAAAATATAVAAL